MIRRCCVRAPSFFELCGWRAALRAVGGGHSARAGALALSCVRLCLPVAALCSAMGAVRRQTCALQRYSDPCQGGRRLAPRGWVRIAERVGRRRRSQSGVGEVFLLGWCCERLRCTDRLRGARAANHAAGGCQGRENSKPQTQKSTARRCFAQKGGRCWPGSALRLRHPHRCRYEWFRGCSCRASWRCRCPKHGAVFPALR